jgi:hypothetical protein
MGRTQTSPELAGKRNMTEAFEGKYKDDPKNNESMRSIVDIFALGMDRGKRVTNWSPEELGQAVHDYFQYSVEKELKVCKAGLRLWLGISHSQFCAWQSDNVKYGRISDIIRTANDVIEMSYIQRSEKFPQANLFLLRSCFGYIEPSKIEVASSNNNARADVDEINDLVNKLGLDRK